MCVAICMDVCPNCFKYKKEGKNIEGVNNIEQCAELADFCQK